MTWDSYIPRFFYAFVQPKAKLGLLEKRLEGTRRCSFFQSSEMKNDACTLPPSIRRFNPPSSDIPHIPTLFLSLSVRAHLIIASAATLSLYPRPAPSPVSPPLRGRGMSSPPPGFWKKSRRVVSAQSETEGSEELVSLPSISSLQRTPRNTFFSSSVYPMSTVRF